MPTTQKVEKKIRIAILTQERPSSPRVIAESLAAMLTRAGVDVRIYYDGLAVLGRALGFGGIVRHKALNLRGKIGMAVGWLLRKPRDELLFRALQTSSAIIICDCIPNAFLRDHISIEVLRKKVPGVPIALHEVYYPGNAPTMLERLRTDGEWGLERFDFYLAVSAVTEIRSRPDAKWFSIGLDLKSAGLGPTQKKRFMALIDFCQAGYEQFRDDQISVLEELNIEYLALENSCSMEEIRQIYAETAVFFMQSPEAFGLPIAECLACGSSVFTPSSSWPMAFRLDEAPVVHGPGQLGSCFYVYQGRDDLRNKLVEVRRNFDLALTPERIFRVFLSKYEAFYAGDPEQIWAFLGAMDSFRHGAPRARVVK